MTSSKMRPSRKQTTILLMKEDLIKFLIYYNLYRNHESLTRELKVKTPFDAVEKWHELKSKIFKENPSSVKKKNLHLNHQFKQDEKV